MVLFNFFYTFYESYFFPGQTPVPPRSWLWILDLSHDPFWAIWLAEVTKSHQHHDRIVAYAAPGHHLNEWWLIDHWTLGNNICENQIKMQLFSFKKMHCKMSSAKCQPFCSSFSVLTHWGQVTHICVSELTIIVSDNGLSSGWHQAIIWTNAWILFIGSLRVTTVKS